MALSDQDAVDAISTFFSWYGPATFFRCPHDPDPGAADIALAGVPYSGGNMIDRGQYLGPRAIRNVSMGYRRTHRQLGVNPFELCRITDIGDPPMSNGLNPNFALADFQRFFTAIDAAGARPVSVGGDHSITLPALRAVGGPQSRRGGPVCVVHFDSHTDCVPPSEPMSHGVEHASTQFYLGVKEGLIDPEHSLQIGMNGVLGHPGQDAYSHELGYRVIDLDECEELGVEGIVAAIRDRVGERPAFLTFDLDVLDLPWAPAVADPEVGGLTARQAQRIVRGMRGMDMVAADFVCYVPRKDCAGEITALSTSAIMHEALTIMAEAVAADKGASPAAAAAVGS
jgi:guanidinopropionase